MILPSLYETYIRVENNYCLIEPIVVYQLLIFWQLLFVSRFHELRKQYIEGVIIKLLILTRFFANGISTQG
jgi:hypothetical protein